MLNKQTAILRLVQLPYHTLNIEAAREIITIYLLSFATNIRALLGQSIENEQRPSRTSGKVVFIDWKRSILEEDSRHAHTHATHTHTLKNSPKNKESKS